MTPSRRHGFTLVELIVVLTLIATITATIEFSVARAGADSTLSIAEEHERTRRLAIETGRPVSRVVLQGNILHVVTAYPDGRLLSREARAAHRSPAEPAQ